LKSTYRRIKLLWLCILLAYSFYVLLWLPPFRYHVLEWNPILNVPLHTYLSLAAYYAFVPGYSMINLFFPRLSLLRKLLFSLGLSLSFFPTATFLAVRLWEIFQFLRLDLMLPMILLIESMVCLSTAMLRELFPSV